VLVLFNVSALFEANVYFPDLPSKEDVLFTLNCIMARLQVAVNRQYCYDVAPLDGGTAAQ
jgi:hypothetical protein